MVGGIGIVLSFKADSTSSSLRLGALENYVIVKEVSAIYLNAGLVGGYLKGKNVVGRGKSCGLEKCGIAIADLLGPVYNVVVVVAACVFKLEILCLNVSAHGLLLGEIKGGSLNGSYLAGGDESMIYGCKIGAIKL